MTSPTTAREAKEFLIAQIVNETARQGAPLDDVERKMLYFTETAWMPEDTWEAAKPSTATTMQTNTSNASDN